MTMGKAKELYEIEAAGEKNSLISAAQFTGMKKMPSPQEWTAFVDKHSGKVQINTPQTGSKPHISINAAFLPNLRTTQVSVSIKNVEFDVDINRFAYLRVRLGYFNGPSAMFRGVIINSYIESPNPNGNTVFQLLDAGLLGDLLTPRDVYIRFSGKTYWVQALQKACDTIGINLDLTGLSSNYDAVPMNNAVKTLRFTCAQHVKNYFERIGKEIFSRFNLPVPQITLQQDALVVTALLDSQQVKKPLPRLNQIKSASFTGGGIMIKAPYNPLIFPMAHFYIEPIFFRGRLNGQALQDQNKLLSPGLVTGVQGSPDGNLLTTDKGLGVSPDGVYQCLTLNVQFDTYGVNEMQISAVQANATVDNSEILRRSLNEHQQKTADGYFLDYPPPAYPPFWEQKHADHSQPANNTPNLDSQNTQPLPTPIVVPVSQQQKTSSAPSIVTLPDILDYWLSKKNLLSGSVGFPIEFDLGGAVRASYFSRDSLNTFSTNRMFLHYFRNHWFDIHNNLQWGAHNGVNYFGSQAQACIAELQSHILNIQKKLRSFTVPEGSEGAFYMLYQRRWLNNNINNPAFTDILPYLSSYIIAGETISSLTFNGTPDDYDNDTIPDIYSRVQLQSRKIHFQGPNWQDCISYDDDILLFLKEIVMWLGDREYSETAGIHYTGKLWRPAGKRELAKFIDPYKRLIDNLSLLKNLDL
jgi:hypothetical protein